MYGLKGSFLQDHQHKQDDSSSSISNMSFIPVISVLNIGWFRRNKNKITVISGTFTLFCFLRTISHVIYIYMYFFFLWNTFSNLSIHRFNLIVNFNFRRNEYSFNQNISQSNKVPLCIFYAWRKYSSIDKWDFCNFIEKRPLISKGRPF